MMTSTTNFSFATSPEIIFGAGKLDNLGKITYRYGKTALLITGDYHLHRNGEWEKIISLLKDEDIFVISISFRNEPSPDFIDSVVMEYGDRNIDVVIGIGGGSVMDAAKAISAMLPQKKRVKTYLEGVGTGAVLSGEKIPLIAIPTTSGSGSEVTPNAVLSSVSEDGFKKSLRHKNLVPNLALIDPQLMLSCPRDITAYTGFDALVQLLESYVSTQSSPVTDALAWSGLEHITQNLLPACGDESENIEVRTGMAYASLMSGIALANAGLGIIHGFASAIGGYFRIPHGIICGTLLAPSIKYTIESLRQENPNSIALRKYAKTGFLISGMDKSNQEAGCDLLIDTLYKWTGLLEIPNLSNFGIEDIHLDMIINETGQKNNPAFLTNQQLKGILLERL